MINSTDTSNTATIPPPKSSARIRLASGFTRRFDGLSTFEKRSRSAGDNYRDLSPLFSVVWSVPSQPGICLAESLSSRWQSYRKQLGACQKNMSVTSVHQLRVATRRLMTCFALLEHVTSDDKVIRAGKKLKRRLKILGELRDVQVQRMFIQQHLGRFGSLNRFHSFLQLRERQLVNNLGRKVHRFKSRKLREWTLELRRQFTAQADNSTKGERLAANLFEATSDAFTQVIRCSRIIDPVESETIHRTRVAFKKFRYMVELLSPAFTGLGKRELRRLSIYQSRMGNLQDLEILESSLRLFLAEREHMEASLVAFLRYLGQRRRRAVRSCLAHADDLFQFWGQSELLVQRQGERQPIVSPLR